MRRASCIAVGLLALVALLPLSPEAKQPPGTSVTASTTATAHLTATYNWTIEKAGGPSSQTVAVGGVGTVAWTISVTKSNTPTIGAYLAGNVCVRNTGSRATQGLAISASVTAPPSSTVLNTAAVDVSARPQLQPTESRCYPYKVTVPAGAIVPGATYKSTAKVTIINQSGAPGVPSGPSPSATSALPTTPTPIDASITVNDTNGKSYLFGASGSRSYDQDYACSTTDVGKTLTVSNTATIASTGQQSTASVSLSCSGARFQVLKYANDTSTRLPGATFQLIQAGTVLQSCTSNSNGICAFPIQLLAGDYTLRESQAPPGYAPVSDSTVTIATSDYGKDVGRAFIDASLPHLEITKYANNTSTKLPGATFQLIQAGTVLQSCTSDSNGICAFPDPLTAGVYTLRESQAPPGYAPVGDSTVTIATSDYGKDVGRAFIDASLPHLEITKYANNTSTKLPGATFQLIQAGTVLQSCTSDSNGICAFPDPLTAGVYTLRESQAPPGYAPVGDSTVTIATSDYGKDVGRAFIDASLPHLEITKYANNTSTKLPGATFQLIQAGTVLQSCTSDSNGICAFPDPLTAGVYTLRESQAPPGYAPVGDSTVTIATSDYGKDVGRAFIDASLPHLEITKYANNTSTKLPGATFQLIQAGTVLQSCTSDSNGICAFPDPLTAGVYTLRESQAPPGYAPVGDSTVTIATSDYGTNIGRAFIDPSLE